MIADQHRGTRLPSFFDATGAIGKDHGFYACRGGGANTVGYATNTVTLVVVGASAKNQRVLSARQFD